MEPKSCRSQPKIVFVCFFVWSQAFNSLREYFVCRYLVFVHLVVFADCHLTHCLCDELKSRTWQLLRNNDCNYCQRKKLFVICVKKSGTCSPMESRGVPCHWVTTCVTADGDDDDDDDERKIELSGKLCRWILTTDLYKIRVGHAGHPVAYRWVKRIWDRVKRVSAYPARPLHVTIRFTRVPLGFSNIQVDEFAFTSWISTVSSTWTER